MQLHPRESFTIVRQIEDHTDSATYYVRAVIRNAKTDALIETVDLVDKGSRRFAQSWLVPADVSGQGFWVTILISVYTDSGYTTKSQNYGDKMDTYLVQERMNSNLHGAGIGPDIDYKKLRKIVEEVVKENKPEMPNIPKVIEVLKERVIVPEVKIPPFPSLDPLLSEIKATKQAIEDKEIPKPEKIDLSPVLKSILEAVVVINNYKDKNKKLIVEELEEMNKRLGNLKVDVQLISPIATAKIVEKKGEEPQLDPRITRILNSKQ